MYKPLWYTKHDYTKSPWVTVPLEIISPELLSYIIKSAKWDIDKLNNDDKDWINIYNWLKDRKEKWYSFSNKKYAAYLMQNCSFQKAKFDKSSQAILNEVIEFAIAELFKAQNIWTQRTCIKASEIDDKLGRIDYIIIQNNIIIWLDITLTSSKEHLNKKKKLRITNPPEFWTIFWKQFLKQSKKHWEIKKVVSKGQPDKLYIPRQVVSLEPNLILNYLNNFIDLIRCIDNPNEIDHETVLEARKRWVEDYHLQMEKWLIHLQWIHNSKHHLDHIRHIENIQKKLFETLSQ